MTEFGIGDVYAVRTGGWVARAIRWFQTWRHGRPALTNHVVIGHHMDSAGVPWGVAGQPGGVGWADLRPILADPWTRANTGQPRTDAQRTQLATLSEAMLGTEYDYTGIAALALVDLNLPVLFAQDWDGKGVPGQIVCSSYAAYIYGAVGVPHPQDGNERRCQPVDWERWANTQGWI